MNKAIILGTQSPRRVEILNYFSLPFEALPSSYDESTLAFEGDPRSYVKALAKGKNHDLRDRYPDRTILTADTIVYAQGKVYGKPSSYEDGKQTLQTLSGNWHSVFTALCLSHDGTILNDVEESRVLFHSLSDAQIDSYLGALHCWDKAGSYQIQEAGSVIINRIEGCYHNIMGLPTNLLQTLLGQAGIDLWSYLDSSASAPS